MTCCAKGHGYWSRQTSESHRLAASLDQPPPLWASVFLSLPWDAIVTPTQCWEASDNVCEVSAVNRGAALSGSTAVPEGTLLGRACLPPGAAGLCLEHYHSLQTYLPTWVVCTSIPNTLPRCPAASPAHRSCSVRRQGQTGFLEECSSPAGHLPESQGWVLPSRSLVFARTSPSAL